MALQVQESRRIRLCLYWKYYSTVTSHLFTLRKNLRSWHEENPPVEVVIKTHILSSWEAENKSINLLTWPALMDYEMLEMCGDCGRSAWYMSPTATSSVARSIHCPLPIVQSIYHNNHTLNPWTQILPSVDPPEPPPSNMHLWRFHSLTIWTQMDQKPKLVSWYQD